MTRRAKDPMPCAECGGRCVRMGIKMPDGRVIEGSVCTKCGASHNAEGPN